MSTETTNTPRYIGKRKNSDKYFLQTKLEKDLHQYKAPVIVNTQSHNNVGVVSVELRPDTCPFDYNDWIDDGTPIVIHRIDGQSIRMSIEAARAVAKALTEAADFMTKLDSDVKASFEVLGRMESANDDDEEDY